MSRRLPADLPTVEKKARASWKGGWRRHYYASPSITFCCHEELLSHITALAKDSNSTVSAVVRRLILIGLKRYKVSASFPEAEHEFCREYAARWGCTHAEARFLIRQALSTITRSKAQRRS